MLDWLFLIFDVIFAFVAIILCIIGLSTLKAIRHLGIGKSFWIPVSMSGAFFLIGSASRIFYEAGVELKFPLGVNTDEIVYVSWLLALCILMYGTYNYSKQVKTMRNFPVLEEKVKEMTKVVLPEEEVEENLKQEAPTVCRHQFGYLRTFPKDASVPDECLGCRGIVECAGLLE